MPSNTPSHKLHKPPRTQRITLLLNEQEQRALNNFCTKYGITNRSKYIRETIMRAILGRIANDQPTLFD